MNANLDTSSFATRPMVRTHSIAPNQNFDTNLFMNYPLATQFHEAMAQIHAGLTPAKVAAYTAAHDTYRLKSVPEPTVAEPTVAEPGVPIELPKPVWVKRGSKMENPNTGETRDHAGHIDAGWNFVHIEWNPVPPVAGPKVVIAISVMDNVDEEIRSARERIARNQATDTRPAYWWLPEHPDVGVMEEDDEPPLPARIKNVDMDDILEKHMLENPPKLKRQTNHPLQENYDWVDKQLAWLSLTVEEAENEAKNEETFVCPFLTVNKWHG